MTTPPPGVDPNINPKAAAKAAKAYAKATRPWYKKPAMIALMVVAVLIVIMVASKGGKSDSSGSTDTGSGAAQEAELEVNAGAMLQEYKDNELSADQKYKGKTVAVSGVVDKVDSEVFDAKSYILRIADGGDFVAWTVNCHGIPNDKLAPIKPGDNVTMVGTVKSGGDLGVELKDCSLR